MNVDIHWDKVLEVEPKIEDNLYFISIVFKDYTICSLGYKDHKQFIKDYTKMMCERR